MNSNELLTLSEISDFLQCFDFMQKMQPSRTKANWFNSLEETGTNFPSSFQRQAGVTANLDGTHNRHLQPAMKRTVSLSPLLKRGASYTTSRCKGNAKIQPNEAEDYLILKPINSFGWGLSFLFNRAQWSLILQPLRELFQAFKTRTNGALGWEAEALSPLKPAESPRPGFSLKREGWLQGEQSDGSQAKRVLHPSAQLKLQKS